MKNPILCVFFALLGTQNTLSKMAARPHLKIYFNSLCVIENCKVCLLRGFWFAEPF